MFSRGSALLPSAPPPSVTDNDPLLEMAYSLRTRLGRKSSDAKTPLDTPPRADGYNTTSSSEKQSTRSMAFEDLSSTPPPPADRRLRSSRDFSRDQRDRTLPQRVLERYKDKSARQAFPAKRKDSAGEEAGGRQDAHLNVADPDVFSSKTVVQGVEFDMLGQTKVKDEGENRAPRPRVARAPLQRRTRSVTKRECEVEAQKSDDGGSHQESGAPTDGLAKVHAQSLAPPPLSIRKVERTPSPRTDPHLTSEPEEPVRDGLWESARRLEDRQCLPSPPAFRTRHTRSETVATEAIANLIKFPLQATPTPTPPPQSDNSIHTPAQVKKSLLPRSLTKEPSPFGDDTPSIIVRPPMPPVDLLGASKGYVFTSPLRGCSRPVEPWAWCKRWTCCACGPEGRGIGNAASLISSSAVGARGGEGGADSDASASSSVAGVLNGDTGRGSAKADGNVLVNGRGEACPAITVAEQRTCSRLACGHVRCAGCWVEGRG